MGARYCNRPLLFVLLTNVGGIAAWSSSCQFRRPAVTSFSTTTTTSSSQPTPRTISSPYYDRSHRHQLFQSASTSDEKSSNSFTEQETETIQNIIKDAAGDDLDECLRNALPSLHPSLVMKLKRANGQHENDAIAQASQYLNKVLNQQLDQAKQTLTDLLNAGEIRKLDAMIGKAARENRLDAAFFNVLTTNLQNAMAQGSGDGDACEESASRSQILQHVYTRCQEEVEKTIPAGTALLNKLLRTEQESIRSNLYKHYLVESSEPQTLLTPDGKTIELQPQTSQALVSLDDFVGALATAVEQIRTVEQAGGTNRETAAALVESCRTVAKEARMVLGNEYGPDAAQVKQLEERLQPVFRPMSADSPYIKGM